MACILDEFKNELRQQCDNDLQHLPYDCTKNKFDIAAAGDHFEFEISVRQHKADMEVTKRSISSMEKVLTGLDTLDTNNFQDPHW